MANQVSFDESRWGQTAKYAAAAVGGVTEGLAGNREQINDSSADSYQTRSRMRQAAMSSGNVYAMAAAAADGLVDAAGGYSDASDTGTNVDFGNKLASTLLPGAGWFAKKAHTISASDELKQSENAYSSTYLDVIKAAKNSGGKFVFGRKKINNMIDQANAQQKIVKSIVNDNKKQQELSKYTVSDISAKNNYELQGGFDSALIRAAGHGGELNRTFTVMPYMDDETRKFQNGGEMNLIPEGALHANLHHMEDDENITKKGIPVVDTDGKLQAEIERNEIVFRIDLTKAIDDLRNKYSKAESQDEKDAILIECGKLLADEIITNTEDRTGLMKEVK